MKLTDENLLREAQKGAVLRHPDYERVIFAGVFFYPEGSMTHLTLNVGMLDDRWSIAQPAPGACKRCKGLGWVLVKEHDGLGFTVDSHDDDCPDCGGTGEEPEVCGWCKGAGRAVHPGTGRLETCICGGSGRVPDSAQPDVGEEPVDVPQPEIPEGFEAWTWNGPIGSWVSPDDLSSCDPGDLAAPDSPWADLYGYLLGGQVIWKPWPRAWVLTGGIDWVHPTTPAGEIVVPQFVLMRKEAE